VTYLILNENWAKDRNMPQYIAYSNSIMSISWSWLRASDVVFYFNDLGHTIYYKNRNYDEYQYSDEEKIVLKLKSVLV